MTDLATTPLGRRTALERSLDGARLTRNHWKLWFLAAMGVFLDGFDLFVMAVAIPLITDDFGLSTAEKGLVAGAAVFGAVLGAFTLGRLGDKIGRQRLFRIDLVLFIVFAVASGLAWDVWSLFVFRFLLGVAIGAEYPLSSTVISEAMPRHLRGRMLVGAFSFQAIGSLSGALVGLTILVTLDDLASWRWLLVVGVIPAIVVAILRHFIPESPRWLAQQGHLDEAEQAARWMLEVDEVPPLTPEECAALDPDAPPPPRTRYGELFSRRWLRRTVFTSVPWFAMDIATYGIGLFTPTIIAAIIVTGANTNPIADDIASTEGTAVVDLFLVAGFVLAILLVERVGRVKLQTWGFLGMIVGMLVLAYASAGEGGGDERLALVFLGFFAFNVFMNMGPNSTTFLLPAEVFPTHLRATGHGFAAGCGKIGASIGVVLVPFLQEDLGESGLMLVMAGVSLVGLLVTIALRVEPMGKSLEELAAGAGDVRPAATAPDT